MLRSMLEMSKVSTSTLASNRHLIWYVLYGMAMSAVGSRQREGKENKVHRAHCNCLQLLLDQDFPVMRPHSAKASCSDLAILKKVDSSLVTVIILKEQLSYTNIVGSDDGGHGQASSASAIKIFEKKLLYCLSPQAPADLLDNVPDGLLRSQLSLSTVTNVLTSVADDKDSYCDYVVTLLGSLELQQDAMVKWWASSKEAVALTVKSRVTAILEETLASFFSYSKVTKHCPIRVLFTNGLKSNKAAHADIEWYAIYSVVSNGNLNLFRTIVKLYFDDINANKEMLTSLVMYSTFYDQAEALALVLGTLRLGNLPLWNEESRFAPFGKITTATSIAIMFSPSCLRCLMSYGAVVSWDQFIDGLKNGLVDDAMGTDILRYMSVNDADRQQSFSEPLEDGDTLLHLACRRGHVGIVRYLLSLKTKIYIDAHGYLPLHYSISCGHGKVTKVLIMSSFFLRRALKTLFHYSRAYIVSRYRRRLGP